MKLEDWGSAYETNISALSYARIYERKECDGNDIVLVYACEFCECVAIDSNGGAVCVIPIYETKMHIEKSTFLRCKTSGRGGAIYFGKKGSCIIYETCGYGCLSGSGKDFSNIYCTNNINIKDNINDTSISYSMNPNNTIAEVMMNYYGVILFTGVNSSFNTCGYNVGCFCYPSQSTIDFPISCCLSYCSFINNTAKGYRIVSLSTLSNKMITSCNVINNEQETDQCGIIWGYGELEIKDSCIIGNVAQYTIYEDLNKYSITVTNCTLDQNVESLINEYVIITNKVSKTFTLSLVHFSTGNCGRKRLRSICFTNCKNKKGSINRHSICVLIIVFNSPNL